jgi:peptide/nickel transport system substrate-binding protein
MKPSPSRFLVTASMALLGAVLARPATRPRYGGSLQVEMSAKVTSLDPAIPAASDMEAEGKRRLDEMLFDRLVRLDDGARALPQLATSWSHDADSKKWEFSLRSDVRLVDGTLLSPQDAAASLAAANSDWHVTASGGSIVIESNSPLPGLPAELALARNSIVHRGEDGAPIGSGPFHVAEWQPGRRAVLAANDDYWGGRPYVDTVEISMGRTPRDQLIDLELGKADVVELAIDQLRGAAQENLRTIASPPAELMAILFAPGKPAPDDARNREALALSLERSAIHDILLQKQGELAGGLLPEWLSGYAFLFSVKQDSARARKLRAEVSSSPALTLSYDASDPLAHAVAERIALDAHNVGLSLRTAALDTGPATPGADARLVRLRLPSADLRTALAAMAQWLHEPVEQLRAESASPDDFYEIERSLLADFRVIPLFYLPQIFAVGSRVRGWSVSSRGGWHPEEAWLATE